MSMVRFTDWDEFVSEIAINAPTGHAVHLTFSVRYRRDVTRDLTLLAWCETRKNWVAFSDDLARNSGEDDSGFVTRAESLLRERKAQLERAGFTVRPGRVLIATHPVDESRS